MDVLKDFDAVKALLWVVPGAMIALFRSFAMRGSFPGVTKDDVAAFVIGSVIYAFLIVLGTGGLSLIGTQSQFSPWIGFVVLLLVPAIAGLGLGLIEASDAVGFSFRKIGIRLPSPDATAWETVFRELESGAVLLVTLKDGAKVFGRWVGGRGGSAASTDAKTTDLYLGEIGLVSDAGQYVAIMPRRGIYLAAAEIRYIEIVGIPGNI